MIELLKGKVCQVCQAKATGITREPEPNGAVKGPNGELFSTFKVKEGSEKFWCKEHMPRAKE